MGDPFGGHRMAGGITHALVLALDLRMRAFQRLHGVHEGHRIDVLLRQRVEGITIRIGFETARLVRVDQEQGHARRHATQ